VTALSVSNGLLFGAQGTSLSIYSQSSNQLLSSKIIFRSQIIHGIAAQNVSSQSSLYLLIWGGRYLAVVHVAADAEVTNHSLRKVSLFLHDTVTLPDWIFDVSFQPQDARSSLNQSGSQPEHAVLVTAHNVLFNVDIPRYSNFEPGTRRKILEIQHLHLGPRCILYSAHLKWASPTEILVASGTAFGEIVAWSYNLAHINTFTVSPHLTLTGHEGSVFGVRISESISTGFGSSHRFLTSCSDDRTIRVWDISDLLLLPAVPTESEHSNKQKAIHTTGFLSNLADHASNATDEKCVAVAMGHLSRIWSVRYSYSASAQTSPPMSFLLAIVSVGEDATCQRWDLSFIEKESDLKFSLKHARTQSNHYGKNIWSLALVESTGSPGDCSVITGGADSGIVSTSFATGVRSELRYKEQWAIGDILMKVLQGTDISISVSGQSDGQHSRKQNKYMLDCFRSYTFVEEDTLLVTTNNGLVLTATLDSTDPKVSSSWLWKFIDTLEELKGYSVVTNVPDSEYAFLAGGKGAVYIFDARKCRLSHLTTLPGKVAGLFVQRSELQFSIFASLLIAQIGGQLPHHLALQRSAVGEVSICDTISIDVSGLNMSTLKVTSYALVSSEKGGELLFIGCREGTILCYFLNSQSPCTTIPRSHGQEAVTGLHWVSRSNSVAVAGWLLSVGRDGTCTIHQFFQDSRDPLLVHKLALPFGPNIEGIYVNPSTKELSVYGFEGKHFVVHDLSTSQDIMNVECGGAHRVWAYKPYLDSTGNISGGTFTWTQASKLNSCGISRPDHNIIERGGHGREIKACAIAPIPLHNTAMGSLIATGAEDTDIRIFSYSKTSTLDVTTFGSLQSLAVLRRHVTGVQSLEWSSDGQYLFSCGGYEEFFVWRLRATPCVVVGVVCESSCPIEVVKSDLRIMSFAVRDEWLPQTERSFEESKMSFLIAMVYSNSVVKVISSPVHNTYPSLIAKLQADLAIHVTARQRNMESACLCAIYFGMHHSSLIS
jgi:WD40 repeat protein